MTSTDTTIVKDSVVTLNYRLKDESDQTLDSSEQHGPMIYIQGGQDILQAIEDAVAGLSVNETASVTIKSEDAYGEYDPDKVSTVPRSAFDGFDELFPGMKIQEETSNGPVLVTIKDITNDQVVVDSNHPLAGQSLYFDLEVKAVRPATAEELDHGHVHHDHSHSEDCHHH